jgi:hypothetical protein
MERRSDRGWSWASMAATSVLVGPALGTMTYLADWGSRGSIIFGAVMSLGWLVAFSIAKVVRDQAETGQSAAVTLRENWFRFALGTILAFDAAFVVVCLLLDRPALALTTAVVAVPLLVTAAVRTLRRVG